MYLFHKPLLFMGLFILAVAAGCGTSRQANVGGFNPSTNFAPGSAQEFSGAVGNKILFETDSSTLSIEARTILDRQAIWLNQYNDHAILIEGHADERGTREYNIALGARRATATKDYLISRGVAATRLKVISYGKERPISICNDISCWSQNRRAITQLNK